MNSFWSGFCEQFKNCGRGATAFIVALAALFVLLIAGAILEKANASPQVLMGATAAAVIWLALLIRRALKRRRERLNFSALSSDELFKARSKLKNGFAQANPFKPARTERPPDIDLKF